VLCCSICDQSASDALIYIVLQELIALQLLGETEEGTRALAAFEAVSYAGAAVPVRLLLLTVYDIQKAYIFAPEIQRTIWETDSLPLESISSAFMEQLRYV
jgi:hypothetical protein